MKYLFTLMSFSFCAAIFAQEINFTKTSLPSFQKIRTINFSKIEDPYQVNLISLEAPNVSGPSYKKALAEIKEKLAISHPKNNIEPTQNRNMADPPQLLESFLGNTSIYGIPLDNHLAFSRDDQILSAINSHIAVMDTGGSQVKGVSLAALAVEFSVGNLFDPRVIYDPVENKFIAVFLAGTSSNLTNIVIAFSASNDATGDWNAYLLPGNPNMNTTWTDYPMISITQTDLIITGNLIRDNESWQLGFDETLIWQLDKNAGYQGADIDNILWQEISFEGTNIRNLCPVVNATDVLEKSTYFLSDRNFATENDTFFFVHLTGGVDDPNTTLDIDISISNQSYGVPPNAAQEIGNLQTNDARVLAAFKLGDQIQFVGNTRNLDNNQAGIYHGIMNNVTTTRDISLNHIIGPDFEIGYPAISYTGMNETESDAIISFNHTSEERFAGISAIYYHPVDGYSEIVTVTEGENFISMIPGVIERWGDYSGNQRNYDNGEIVWVSGFKGASNLRNIPWVASLARPGALVNDTAIDDQHFQHVFPNPSSQRVTFQFFISHEIKAIQIDLLDVNGKKVSNLLGTNNFKKGQSEISFEVNHLAAGIYFVRVLGNNAILTQEKIVVK